MVPCKLKQVIQLNNAETKIFLETRLRNLKRKNAKLAQYPSLTDEYFEIEKEISIIKEKLNLL